MTHPKVTIIVLNWNGIKDTVKCLDSLKKIHYSNFEIIVVDNASNGNDVEILKEKYKDEIILIENKENLGFAIGNNNGMKYALEKGTDYVLLLNNDTVVDPLFLDELIKITEKDSEIGIASPKMYYMNPPNVLWSAGGKINWYIGHWLIGKDKKDNGQFDEMVYVDFNPGACMLIKRETIEKIGYLPTEYFLQWEDIDYCIKAKKNGFKCIYVPKSKIWHKVLASYNKKNLNHASVILGFRNRIIFRHKYLSHLKFVFFTVCFIIIVIPIHILYYLFCYRDLHRIRSLLTGTLMGFNEVLLNNKKHYRTLLYSDFFR